jgi:hypothetical protein
MEVKMTFLVECCFQETVLLGGLFLDGFKFTVEAPTARIAECKVRICYPQAGVCHVNPIGRPRMTKTEARRLLVTAICCYLAIFAFLKFNSFAFFSSIITHVEWLDDMIYAGVILFMLLMVVSLGHVFFEWVDGERLEGDATQEREYFRRLGYTEGWRDCERKMTPQFAEWVAGDSRDFHPFPGPASAI